MELWAPTWRIIPVSKWLVTPIYKPVRPFIGGITLFMDLLTMVSLLPLCIGGISVACFFRPNWHLRVEWHASRASYFVGFPPIVSVVFHDWKQGSSNVTNPNNAIIMSQITQNYHCTTHLHCLIHWFPPKMANLMTPGKVSLKRKEQDSCLLYTSFLRLGTRKVLSLWVCQQSQFDLKQSGNVSEVRPCGWVLRIPKTNNHTSPKSHA